MKPLTLHRAVLPTSLCVGVLLGLSLLLPGCGDDDNPVQTQGASNSLVGSWKLVRLNGQVSGVNMVWSFSDTSVTVTSSTPPATFSGTYSYNPNADPKTIDIRLTGSTPNPNLAIYRIAQPDTLVLKVMDGASARATNFNVEQGYDLEELTKQ